MIVGCEHRVGRERRVEYLFTNPYSAILPFCLEKKNDFGRIRRVFIIVLLDSMCFGWFKTHMSVAERRTCDDETQQKALLARGVRGFVR